MKRVQDKMIKENIRLDQCQPNDNINITYKLGGNGAYCSIGRVTLIKIKSIRKGKIQIKYKNYHNSTVQKADLPESLTVERTRKWVREDGPDAGYIPHETRKIQRTDYHVTDPTQSVTTSDQSQTFSSLDSFEQSGVVLTSPSSSQMISVLQSVMQLMEGRIGISLYPGLGKTLPGSKTPSLENMKNITPRLLSDQ